MSALSETRQQLLEVLGEVLAEQPDMRFGQLIAGLALFAVGPIKGATWDAEDDELLDAAKRHLENLRNRRLATAQLKQVIAERQHEAAN